MITMKLRGTQKRSILGANTSRTLSLWARSALALLLAGLLAGGPLSPVFAQSPAQNPPSNPAPAPSPAPDGSSIAPVSSLGLGAHDYSHGPSAFPNILKPYESIHIDRPVLTNSPRLDQLVHDGKLEISLQDAVELALENSLDIAVQRYYPWMADAGVLNAKSGSSSFGTPGATYGGSSAQINPFVFYVPTYDPIITNTTEVADVSTPINNPFSSGAGTSSVAAILSHSFIFNNQYSQTFETGTNLTAAWDNTRSSSSAAANFLNPYVQSTLSVSITQPLLNGYGLSVGTRNIRIAKNDRKIADWAFAQQAITTITNTITAYWELVYARENVKVNQQAVDVAEKLYEDNKKQLQIGSIAPLDVTRSESEVATDTGTLVAAQTTQLTDEQTLKNYISKDPLAPNIINVEIIPTDEPKQPAAIETASFEDSVKEAFAKRPDLQEQVYNVKNAEIDVKATKNALLPSLAVSGYFAATGLAGNSAVLGAPTLVSSGIPIVDATGAPVLVNGAPVFESATTAAVTGTTQQGFTTAQSQIFHNQFPTYAGELTLTLPLRNRSAQAYHARAILEQRQLETQVQQLRNAALLDVRNSYIQLTQDRAQVASAMKARQLQQETFDAEQKKYQLGASTTYLVIQTQRDLIAAQGTELRALANLEEAKASYERAVGRTLEVNHVTIADAQSGEVERETLIPGTLHGKVVGMEDLFKSIPDGG
ncbi:MAG: TolC family protein, partial [Candidatus Acidiferrum sp.]